MEKLRAAHGLSRSASTARLDVAVRPKPLNERNRLIASVDVNSRVTREAEDRFSGVGVALQARDKLGIMEATVLSLPG